MKLTKQQRKIELASRGLKQCPQCPEPKLLSEFRKHKSQNDGLQCLCKEHQTSFQKEYANKPENKAKISNQDKEYRARPEVKEKRKEYTDKPKNKKKAKKYQIEYYIDKKEEILKQCKEYREKEENKIRQSSYQKEWRKKNKEKIKRDKQEYWHIKKNDTVFKVKEYLRHRIYSALKGNTKSLSTMFLIGCEIDYLMYLIQEKFTEGMSWDNYGDWHIDHIKPCAKFDLSKPSEQVKCFNFTNLQPLWAKDNLKKGSKYGFSF